MKHYDTRPRGGVSVLFHDLKDEVSNLVRDTAALLRQELTENAQAAQAAAIGMIARATILSVGLLFTLAGIDILIALLISPALMDFPTAICVTTLVIGVAMSVGGYLAAMSHRKKLDPERLVPQKTLQTIEEHGEWIASKAEELVR